MKYVVQVISYDDQKVVKEFAPETNERQAERLDRGVNINLDHERFFTRIDEREDAAAEGK